MSVFETIYAESIYRDLVRFAEAVNDVDKERITARMVDNIDEAVRDLEKARGLLVNIVMNVNIDQDPDDIVTQVHKIIRPHFIDQEVSA